MKLLQNRFDIKTIVVTLGGDGAVINENGSFFRHNGYPITVADTIGSGDAFLAGYLNQKLQRCSVTQALDFASAVGAFVATQHGACPAYSISQIHNLMNSRSTINLQTKQ